MINEGAKILDEGKAIRASDIDIIWINGYNWPAYRGGPMYYADQHRARQGRRPAAGAGGERRSAVDAGTAARTSRRRGQDVLRLRSRLTLHHPSPNLAPSSDVR